MSQHRAIGSVEPGVPVGRRRAPIAGSVVTADREPSSPSYVGRHSKGAGSDGAIPGAPAYSPVAVARTGRHRADPEHGPHLRSRSLPVLSLLPLRPTLAGSVALLVAAAGALHVAESGRVAASPVADVKAAPVGFNGALGSTNKVELMTDAGRRTMSRSADRGTRRLEVAAAQLEVMSTERADALAHLDRLAVRYDKTLARRIEADRWVLPVDEYRLTGTFGESSYLWSTTHTGLDFAAPDGTPIRSVAAGVVSSAGWDGAYGYRTVVTLQDGTEIWYCHQSSMNVEVGQSVARGQVIGAVGATGNVTGAHLHLEVRPGGGSPVDPYAALVEHGSMP